MSDQATESTIASELRPRRGRPAQFTAEQRADRAKLSTKAQALATALLRQRHDAEYSDLYQKAKKEVGLE